MKESDASVLFVKDLMNAEIFRGILFVVLHNHMEV
jgi:hypothetical protein